MKNYKWYDLPKGDNVHVNMDLVRYSTCSHDGFITLYFDEKHKLTVKEPKGAYDDS